MINFFKQGISIVETNLWWKPLNNRLPTKRLAIDHKLFIHSSFIENCLEFFKKFQVTQYITVSQADEQEYITEFLLGILRDILFRNGELTLKKTNEFYRLENMIERLNFDEFYVRRTLGLIFYIYKKSETIILYCALTLGEKTISDSEKESIENRINEIDQIEFHQIC
jgi:hypothetical protein